MWLAKPRAKMSGDISACTDVTEANNVLIVGKKGRKVEMSGLRGTYKKDEEDGSYFVKHYLSVYYTHFLVLTRV